MVQYFLKVSPIFIFEENLHLLEFSRRKMCTTKSFLSFYLKNNNNNSICKELKY